MNGENITRITASVLAVAVVLGVIAFTALQVPVPDPFWSGFGLVLGFFFGHSTGSAQARAR